MSGIRIRYVAREYWFELLIAFLALAGMLELVVGRNSPGAPSATLWVSATSATMSTGGGSHPPGL